MTLHVTTQVRNQERGFSRKGLWEHKKVEEKTHLKKSWECPGILGTILFVCVCVCVCVCVFFFSSIGNDPKKHKTNFATHPVPGQYLKFVHASMCFFFP